MALRTAHQPLYTVEEFLEREAVSDVRHEFVGGQIFAMTGATRRHHRIALNVGMRMFGAAADGECRVSIESVLLRAADDALYYPDVMVACGPEHDDPLVERDPCSIVEIVSPSSRTTDRREKVRAYTAIETMQSYAIVHQERRRVEWYLRGSDGRWAVHDVVGSGTIDFPCPAGVSMTLDEIYHGAEPAPRAVRRDAL